MYIVIHKQAHNNYAMVYLWIISERKLDGMSGDLVNGDHLSIPGMRDYSYGSFGAYNQMSPSPKSVIPQSPSPAGMSYTVGKLQLSLL